MARVFSNEHSHPCADCGAPVACDAERYENYDGFPTVICPAYHRFGGYIAVVRCQTCDANEAARAAADAAENVPEDVSPEAVCR
jgi:hypothetical protein